MKLINRLIGWSRFKRVYERQNMALLLHNPCQFEVCSPVRHRVCERKKMCAEPIISGTYFEAEYLKSQGVKPSKSSVVNAAKLEVLRRNDFKACRCVELLAREVKAPKSKARRRDENRT